MKASDPEFFKKDRQKYTDAILNSTSRKKLIVSGPGTGKTYTFGKALRKIKKITGEGALAITFIRTLVADLKRDLAGLATVSTFHAFCKSRLHAIRGDEFDYYPALFKILGKDFEFLGRKPSKEKELEGCFFDLKDDDVISSALSIGDYYNATGHSDSVYRVIKYFESYPRRIPTYPLIVVDEYQDFNFLETRLIEILSQKSHVLIVGDDDQALYFFKHASTKYIIRLAQDHDYERFELPYCSRCTKVIVEAVNDIVQIATNNGLLKGRVDKPFKYFPPDKEPDSKRHPSIIKVRCSVERAKCHYMGQFIATEISQIPKPYIRESNKRGEPTVLVIGPSQFLRGIKKVLKEKLEYSDEEESTDTEVNLLDGYRLLAKNPDSRLGWRIVIHCKPFRNANKIIKRALSDRIEISSLIPSEQYKSKHIELANLATKIIQGEELTVFERPQIEEAVNRPLEDIKKYLETAEEKALKADEPSIQRKDRDENEPPYILCTTFEKSKGLAAQYVFIVGMNNGHFPRKPNSISNRDVCRLIVALTRTRAKCYVVSCGNFAGERLYPSVFLGWLKDKLSKEIYVNKQYIEEFCS